MASSRGVSPDGTAARRAPAVDVRLPSDFLIRPVDPAVDLPAVTALYAACDLEDVGEVDDRGTWTEQAWRSTFLVGAWMVLEREGDVAAYVEMSAVDPSRSIDAVVPTHPRHRAGPLRSALIAFVLERACEAARAPDVALWLSESSTDETFARDVIDAGFRRVRVFLHMERVIDASFDAGEPLPGIAIRAAADPEDDRTVWRLLEASFAGHFGIEPMSFDAFLTEFKDEVYDASLVLIAEVDGVPVGVCANWVIGDIGWVGDLGVVPDARGRGIGRALLRRSLALLAARGLTRVRLNVDSENASGATRLYEGVGMRVRRSFDVYEARVTAG